MIRYVVDASVVIKWFIPEMYSDAACFLQNSSYRLHAPALFVLEVGNALCKKTRRRELLQKEVALILEELACLPIQKHPDSRLFGPAVALALQTHRSLYDCLYLALAETIDGQVVTADRKFYMALADSPYARRICWVEEIRKLA